MTAIATRTARTSSAVAVVQKRPGPIAVRQNAPRAVIAAGLRGAPGRNGGITYVRDHEPVGATESETWWNPLTLQLKVYHSNEFEPVSSDGVVIQRSAGHPISALRVVYEASGLVYALDYRDAAHIDLLVGITMTAADGGAPIAIQRAGEISDSGWAWTPGRVYLGVAGQLTQTPPETGYSVLIGSAVSATRILLNLQDPIELE